jgi:carnitine-CoA ligase
MMSPATRSARPPTDKSGWTVGHVLARQAAERGGAPFLQFQNAPALTYAEVDALANRVGRGIVGLGVKPGASVAVMLPNGAEILLAWFGLCRAGAVSVFVNTAYKGIFLEHVLNNAGAEVMIVHRDLVPALAESLGAVPKLRRVFVVGAEGTLPSLPGIAVAAWDALLADSSAPLDVPVSYRDLGSIMYTSGTTGPSKGVLMPHAHLYLFGHEEARWLKLTPRDVYYVCMPLFHANALFMQIYGTLCAGAKAVIVPVFSASRWLDDVRLYGATVTNTLGVMCEFVYRQPPRPEDRDHKLRVILAVPAPAEIAQVFMDRFGTRLIEGYGMTEINIPAHGRIEDPYRPGSSGRVNTDYFELKIVDPETDEEVAPGQMGEIVCRPKEPYGFMAGYNGMADKTVEAWRNFWFHTGDAGRIDAEGFVYFLDRIKDTIRRRGENLSSYEIERVLTEHPAVAEAVAIAVKSTLPGGEDDVKACIVLKPEAAQGGTVTGGAAANGAAATGASDLQAAPRPEELLDWCVKRMPYFAVPRYIEFVAALPKTPTQKVQKNKLREIGVSATTWDREQAGYRVSRG